MRASRSARGVAPAASDQPEPRDRHVRQAGLAAAVERGQQRQQRAVAQHVDRRRREAVGGERGDAGAVEAARQRQQRRCDRLADALAVQRRAGDQLGVAELAEQPAEQVGDGVRQQQHFAGERRRQGPRMDLALGVAQHLADAEAFGDRPLAQVVRRAAGAVERARLAAFARGAEQAGLVPAEAAREIAAAAGAGLRFEPDVGREALLQHHLRRLAGAIGEQLLDRGREGFDVALLRPLDDTRLLAARHRVGVVARRRRRVGVQARDALRERRVVERGELGAGPAAVDDAEQRELACLGAAQQARRVVLQVELVAERPRRRGLGVVEALRPHQRDGSFRGRLRRRRLGHAHSPPRWARARSAGPPIETTIGCFLPQ